jgi:hypothetical protein
MGTKFDPAEKIIYKKIEEILCFDWDPIGVGELPRDEFASYVPEIYRLKKKGASNEEIAQNLYTIAKDTIGMPGTIEFCRDIAKKIEDI